MPNDCELSILRDFPGQKLIAIAGNPNVGKSTIFNYLTGMNQHTGNWPGKTVSNAQGEYEHKGRSFKLVDIPGTYSLISSSLEEEVARDFICFANPDAIIVVLDATCLERNLNLALQILEITKDVVVCVNLIDEAEKKKIHIDIDELSLQLGVPVVCTNARSGIGIDELMDEVYNISFGLRKTFKIDISYDKEIEDFIDKLSPYVKKYSREEDVRFIAVKLLNIDKSFEDSLSYYLDYNLLSDENVDLIIKKEKKRLKLSDEEIEESIVSSIVSKSEGIYSICVRNENKNYNERDRRIDRFLTSKATGIPTMILLLGIIFWITLVGANYPSELLSTLFSFGQEKLTDIFVYFNAPSWLYGSLVLGVYRTLTWVVAVMLPPMAIFFPLFTLLEDSGYLPRIAFNLDKVFRKAGAHGKQALTTCMGFGCNACGIIGCRIIDSPRERMIAILTNNFIPCNGRFPTLIAIITMFFACSIPIAIRSLVSTIILLLVVIVGIIFTLIISKILSKTILKGMPSTFALELPPYRRPQIGKVIVRSIFDRTLFVLGRAVSVASIAGLIIWIMANITVDNISLLKYCSDFLDPFARLLGLDGVILMAFILGFPANEIVVPIIIMSYLCTGSIIQIPNVDELFILLSNNGWTIVTAACTMVFSLMHFPCGTTCLTIKKETGSWKWTILSFIIPTITGMIVCFIIANTCRLLGIN